MGRRRSAHPSLGIGGCRQAGIRGGDRAGGGDDPLQAGRGSVEIPRAGWNAGRDCREEPLQERLAPNPGNPVSKPVDNATRLAAVSDLRKCLEIADQIGVLEVVEGADPDLEMGALYELSLQKPVPPVLL